MTGYALAVDIGGTFTDIVLRRADGRTWVDKTLTTHADLLDGFFHGVDLVLSGAGVQPGEVTEAIVHATTIVTNALIERRGAPTALIVTRGFRDVLYIRDEHRYDMFDPQIEFAEPLVAREQTFGVAERTLADGSVAVSVDPAEIRELATELTRRGIKSVAVCLLNSFRNPQNERAIAQALRDYAPDLYVSLSSDVAPQIREYPRASTAAINAYTRPITQPYLQALSQRLRDRGFPNRPLIMLSNGGVIGEAVAGRFPVRMIESGPAAGALAASYYSELLGLDRLMSFDMGGTTAKACLIEQRSPLVAGTFEVDRMYRFKAGSGMPVTIPSIDMIEIGAGGGSIASVDALGLLKVGPQSAGSEPGPACYGRGGGNPTVTDADLMLGLLDPDNFLGGDMRLDRVAAERQIQRLSEALKVSGAETAAGIYRVVAEAMASAARAHATDRGVDYRGMPLLAFGGAGPVHACAVAELLQSASVIFPPQASVLSAFGTLVTPARLDLVRGALGRLAAIEWDDVNRVLTEMTDEGVGALVEAGVPDAKIRFSFGGDLRYLGQQNEVTVAFSEDPRTARDVAQIREAFESAYELQYGIRLSDVEVEVVSWRVTAQGPESARAAQPSFAAGPGAAGTKRQVLLDPAGVSFDVYERAALTAAQQISGPALIEERETTIVLLPGWQAEVHPTGCIIAKRAEADGRN